MKQGSLDDNFEQLIRISGTNNTIKIFVPQSKTNIS